MSLGPFYRQESGSTKQMSNVIKAELCKDGYNQTQNQALFLINRKLNTNIYIAVTQ